MNIESTVSRLGNIAAIASTPKVESPFNVLEKVLLLNLNYFQDVMLLLLN